MTIKEKTHGGITILDVSGRLDSATAPDAERRLAELSGNGAQQVVLVLSNVDYVSSAGLRVLLSTARRVQQGQGKLVLAAPAPQVRQILDMAGFAAIIPIFDTVHQACDVFAPAAEPAQTDLCPLSFAEELYLLALDDKAGVVRSMPAYALDYALGGAILMELALANRIDSDLTALNVISSDATGDALLDDVLKELHERPELHSISYWLKTLADQSTAIEKRVLASLIRKGILRQENRRVLWVFEVRRYPLVGDREVKEVRTRLRELIFGTDIPEARDIVLVSLGNACRLLDDLFSAEEFEKVEPRITTLSRLDLIGEEMSKVIREIELAVTLMPAI